MAVIKNLSLRFEFKGEVDKTALRSIYRLRTIGFIAACGNGLTGVVLSLFVAQYFPARTLGVAMALLGFGMVFSFTLGGKAADFYNRARILSITDFIRAGMNGLILFAAFLAPPYSQLLLYLGCLGNGLMVGYFRPSHASLWASLVPVEHLQRTQAQNRFLNRFGLAIGGLLGSLVIWIEQMEIGIAFDALTFLITGLLALTIMDARTKQSKDVEEEIVKGVWVAFKKFGAKLRIDRDWAEIFELTKESLWMRIWLSSNIGFSLTASIASTCLPIVLLKTYSSSQVGIYSATPQVALFVGGTIALLIRDIPFAGVWNSWQHLGKNLGEICIALNLPIVFPTTLSFSGYFASAVGAPALDAYVAQQYSEEKRGRIFAATIGAGSVLMPVGMLLGSAALTYWDATRILLVSSVISAILVALPLFNPAYWNLKQQKK